MLVISRHMALGPPETSGASYFSSGRIIVDARLQRNIVPAGWYSTHSLCMSAGWGSQAHTTTPKTGDNEDLSSPKVVGGTVYPSLCLRYQQS